MLLSKTVQLFKELKACHTVFSEMLDVITLENGLIVKRKSLEFYLRSFVNILDHRCCQQVTVTSTLDLTMRPPSSGYYWLCSGWVVAGHSTTDIYDLNRNQVIFLHLVQNHLIWFVLWPTRCLLVESGIRTFVCSTGLDTTYSRNPSLAYTFWPWFENKIILQ